MNEKTGKVLCVSKHGGIKFEGDEPDKWYNSANDPVKDKVTENWGQFKGNVVTLTLDDKGKYTGIDLDYGEVKPSESKSVPNVNHRVKSSYDPDRKDRSIVRQCCLKCACKLLSIRGDADTKLVLKYSEEFENWVNR